METSYPIAFSKHHSHFVVGILDIVKSTETTTRLDGAEIDLFYTIFLSEVTKTVYEQEGIVIKNIGDGILFYFPKSDYATPVVFESIVAAARAIRSVRDVINAKLMGAGLPEISYRISMSFGPVSVMLGKNEEIIDLFGSTVSTCAKINKLAQPNTIVVGEELFEHLDMSKEKSEKIGRYQVREDFGFDVFMIQ